MAGIFPSDSGGGVPPTQADNAYTPTNIPTCPVLYFSRDCTTTLEAAVMNAILSEIVCAVDKLGFAYNCTNICNLGEALRDIIANVDQRLDALEILDASDIELNPDLNGWGNVQTAIENMALMLATATPATNAAESLPTDMISKSTRAHLLGEPNGWLETVQGFKIPYYT
jgi:hypothetical protein